MSHETLMLAKGFSLPQVTYPAFISEKLDGVAVKIMGHGDGYKPTAITRQGEPSLAIGHILTQIGNEIEEGWAVVGELYIPGKPFKYISGLSRHHATEEELCLYVYDIYPMHLPAGVTTSPYKDRRLQIVDFVRRVNSPNVRYAPGIKEWVAFDQDGLTQGIQVLMPKVQEGLVIRSANEVYIEGKRSWGMQKLKKVQTADLKVIGLEEAVSKDGEPLAMVGRIIVKYHGQHIGVGPGKMIHEDRKGCWKRKDLLIGHIIEVAYMPDPSYDALREPRFIRMRPDKMEESYE